MKSLLTVLFLASLTACKIVSCPTAQTIAAGASKWLASPHVADCSNPEAIEADIMAFLDKEGTCKGPPPTGPIAYFACPLLSRLVADRLWKKVVPEKYGCKGGNAKAAMELALTAGCNLIPF